MKIYKSLRPFSILAAAAGMLSFAAIAQEKKDETASAETETLVAGEFTFKYAKPWERRQPGSSMRVAEMRYEHTKEGLKPVDVIFYAGFGGGVDANMQRWVGQFEGEPKVERETLEFDGKKAHLIYAKGTFLVSASGAPFAGPKTPTDGYMMLGAILESDQGDVFLKMVGDEKSVTAAKDAFIKLVKSPYGK